MFAPKIIRSSVLATLFAVSIAFAATDPAHLVVLRGKADAKQLTFVTDETGLDRAQLAGVSGAELLALQGQRLLAQAQAYRDAQVASGTAPDALQPMYVVFDPDGTWAYATPWRTFSYERAGQKYDVTAPALLMGEKMDHQGQAVEPTPESKAANEQLIAKLEAFVTEKYRAAKKTPPNFRRDVLDRWQITIGAKKAAGLSQVTGDLTSDRFYGYLKRATVSALDSAKLDGAKEFETFAKDAKLDDVVAGAAHSALQREVAETVAHELGHVIQFAALGLYQYKAPPLGVQMADNSHSLQTLSSQEFALVEGWGEANSMVVVGLPKEGTPGEANRISYASSVSAATRKLNQRAGAVASAELHARGALKPDEPLTTPPLDSKPEEFRAGLEAEATRLGQPTVIGPKLDADRELKTLGTARTYLTDLQAKQGQLRTRYDFLRSEYAVANALAQLRLSLGPNATKKVLNTYAKHKPRTFAELVEAFVQDNPELKSSVYHTLARATDGILITEAQADFVDERSRAGESLHIDIDQDGKVPGTNAATANPTLFARDLPEGDPLAPAATASTPAAPIAAEPSSAHAIEVANEPSMDGIERR